MLFDFYIIISRGKPLTLELQNTYKKVHKMFSKNVPEKVVLSAKGINKSKCICCSELYCLALICVLIHNFMIS